MHNKPIVVVSDFGYIEGGAVAVAVKTALLLASKGRKVIFFCGEGPVCDELAASDVETICLGMPSINSNPSKFDAIRKGVWNTYVYKSFSDLLNRNDLKGAIIHIHTWTKVLSSAVFAAATEKGNPVLLTVHDYFSVCPNGGFYDYNEKRICERKPCRALAFVTTVTNALMLKSYGGLLVRHSRTVGFATIETFTMRLCLNIAAIFLFRSCTASIPMRSCAIQLIILSSITVVLNKFVTASCI